MKSPASLQDVSYSKQKYYIQSKRFKKNNRKQIGSLSQFENKRNKRPYIFFIGNDSSNLFTDEEGTTVCCAGLFMPLTSLASIYKFIYKPFINISNECKIIFNIQESKNNNREAAVSNLVMSDASRTSKLGFL